MNRAQRTDSRRRGAGPTPPGAPHLPGQPGRRPCVCAAHTGLSRPSLGAPSIRIGAFLNDGDAAGHAHPKCYFAALSPYMCMHMHMHAHPKLPTRLSRGS